jgi:hypothetical protein
MKKVIYLLTAGDNNIWFSLLNAASQALYDFQLEDSLMAGSTHMSASPANLRVLRYFSVFFFEMQGSLLLKFSEPTGR